MCTSQQRDGAALASAVPMARPGHVVASESRPTRFPSRPQRSSRPPRSSHPPRSTHTPSTAETMPWSQTSPADSVRRSTALRLKQFTLVLSLVAGAAAAVALAALVPLLAGTTPAERVQTQLLIVLFPAALSFGALVALVLVQWRARRLAADTLRRTARELQRGAWRSAVERMRDMPPAEPSAFGDLADQVEGVMGESERRWQARVELSHEWYWETDERHRLSSLSAEAPMVKPAGRALGDLLGRRHDELAFVHPPGRGLAGVQPDARAAGRLSRPRARGRRPGRARAGLGVAHRPPAPPPRWPLRGLRGRRPRHHRAQGVVSPAAGERATLRGAGRPVGRLVLGHRPRAPLHPPRRRAAPSPG